MHCAIIIGSTVFLFNFSACFSNGIRTDDAQKPVFTGTILHCTYSFWGLPSPDPLLSRYTPCHYILDKGLDTSVLYRRSYDERILSHRHPHHDVSWKLSAEFGCSCGRASRRRRRTRRMPCKSRSALSLVFSIR